MRVPKIGYFLCVLLWQTGTAISFQQPTPRTCNTYSPQSSLSADHLIYTLSDFNGSSPPSQEYYLVQRNVSCPCEDYICLRMCCTTENPCDTLVDFTDKSNPFEFGKLPSFHLFSSYLFVYGGTCDSNGVPARSTNVTVGEEQYCLGYSEIERHFQVFYCSRRVTRVTVVPISMVFSLCLMASIFFLVLTFYVYSCFESLRTLPGKILLCYVFCLLVVDSTHLALQLLLIVEGGFCMVSGRSD